MCFGLHFALIDAIQSKPMCFKIHLIGTLLEGLTPSKSPLLTFQYLEKTTLAF